MKLWLANGNCVLANDARGARQRAIDQGYISPDVPCEVVQANDDGTPIGKAVVIPPSGKPASKPRTSSRGSRRGSTRTPPEGR